MYLLEVLFIAFALSVDAFVCSVIYGKGKFSTAQKINYALIVSGAFGIFQFMMPLIGYYAGEKVQRYIVDYDHWLAFLLLLIVSVNMIKEGCQNNRTQDPDYTQTLGFFTVLSLAIATSIDAIALGFSIGVLQEPIFFLSTVTGIVCFSTSFIGFMIGQFLARFSQLDRVLNVIGAFVLMSIGTSVLFDHGVFSQFDLHI